MALQVAVPLVGEASTCAIDTVPAYPRCIKIDEREYTSHGAVDGYP
ncbi:hypothetical protein [Mucilaginibacter hurinus]|nr:hypothetical protein [Mucilaginibacter hurinus]